MRIRQMTSCGFIQPKEFVLIGNFCLWSLVLQVLVSERPLAITLVCISVQRVSIRGVGARANASLVLSADAGATHCFVIKQELDFLSICSASQINAKVNTN